MPPLLSVIIVNIRPGNPVAAWAKSLEAALTTGEAELLLVVPPEAALIHTLPSADRIKIVEVDRDMRTADQRDLGVRAAQGRYLALSEGHCVPDDQWWPAWKSHLTRGSSQFAWGPVDRRDGRAVDWAMTFFEYGKFLTDLETSSPALCLVNGVIRADLVARLGSEPALLWDEYALDCRLNNLSISREFCARAVVLDAQISGLFDYVRQLFGHGCSHGRIAYGKLSPMIKLFRLFAAPLIAVLLVARIGRVALKSRRGGRFLRALPYLAWMSLAWTLGEACGTVRI
jgi:hypothetical protein